NYIIYRLTDIMLLKAEALVLKIQEEGAIAEGTPDYELYSQAFELVDAVNKRSLLEPTPYTHVLDITKHATKLGALNLVYDERQRELMFEGKRYFDLVRRSLREDNTDYLANHVSNKNASTAAIVRSKMQKIDAIFWPYNLDETKCNKNLVQNPAFGSGENSSYEKTN
ncbi:MAG: RagB/SusD family nutrient uptake outer membrane protein, partial [Prevotella sp.]|nr:RagB/SusD family nutrient uptake outer membrane protein [Prevotella sp.]